MPSLARHPARALVTLGVSLALLPAGSALAQPADAAAIMQKSQDVQDQAKDRRATMTMTLVNKRGEKRVRKVATYLKKYGEDNRSILYFLEPADVKDTAFLQYGYEQEDDDQWIYLPALKKVRKITASSKNQSFMGTDFTYDDMSTRTVEQDDHKVISEDGNGWVIESKPKEPEEDDAYSKVVSWVRRADHLPAKVDFYDEKGVLLKTLTTGQIQTIGGIPTPLRLEMHDKQSEHRTVLDMADMRYDTGLADSLFEKDQLEKGPPQ